MAKKHFYCWIWHSYLTIYFVFWRDTLLLREHRRTKSSEYLIRVPYRTLILLDLHTFPTLFSVLPHLITCAFANTSVSQFNALSKRGTRIKSRIALYINDEIVVPIATSVHNIIIDVWAVLSALLPSNTRSVVFTLIRKSITIKLNMTATRRPIAIPIYF